MENTWSVIYVRFNPDNSIADVQIIDDDLDQFSARLLASDMIIEYVEDCSKENFVACNHSSLEYQIAERMIA